MAEEMGRPNDARDRKLSVNSPAVGAGELVRQPHGGALRHGGGSEIPSPGRPPSHIRRRALTLFEKNLKWVDKIMQDPATSNLDRLRALDLVGKYGLGPVQGVQVDQVRDRLKQTLMILERMLPPEFAVAVMAAIEDVWK